MAAPERSTAYADLSGLRLVNEQLESLCVAAEEKGKVTWNGTSFLVTSTVTTETWFGSFAARLVKQVYRYAVGGRGQKSLLSVRQLKERTIEELSKLRDLDRLDPTAARERERTLALIDRVRAEALPNLCEAYGDRPGWVRLCHGFTREGIEAASLIPNRSAAFLQQVHCSHARASNRAHILVARAAENKAALRSIPFSDRRRGVQVPNAVMEGVAFDAQWKSGASRALVRLETLYHLASRRHHGTATVPPIPVQNGEAEWVSYRIIPFADGSLHVERDKSYRSAELNSGKSGLRHNNLTNIKVQVKDSKITITCGVINTKRKAEQFVEAVRVALEQRTPDATPIPTRLSLRQLNSFGVVVLGKEVSGERQLITGEHRTSYQIEKGLRKLLSPEFCQAHALEGPRDDRRIVAHTNTSFNFLSRVTSAEALCQSFSLEGLGTQALWACDTLAAMEGTEAVDAVAQTQDALRRAVEGGNLANSRHVKAAQTDLRQALIGLTGVLEVQVPSMERDRDRLCAALLVDVLRAGLDTDSGRVRVKELEVQLLLDILLDIITELNCKSGLDRTGLARAIYDALLTLIGERMGAGMDRTDAIRDVYRMVLSLDSVLADLSDRLEAWMEATGVTAARTFEELETTAPVPNYMEAFEQWLVRTGTSAEEVAILMEAMHYQNLVTRHLFDAQIITLDSTGVVGLKYGHEKWRANIPLAHNPHPLRRVAMVMATEEGRLFRVYGRERALIGDQTLGLEFGKKNIITPIGIAVLERASRQRGK